MNGKFISGPASIFVLILFFLPWVTISCEGVPMGEFSGYELAIGTEANDTDDDLAGPLLEADPIFFVIPLVAVVSLVLLVVTLWKPSFEINGSWGQFIAATVGLLIPILKWLQLREASDGIFDIVIRPALWGTIVGLAAIGVGAIIDLVWSSQGESQDGGVISAPKKQAYAHIPPPPPPHSAQVPGGGIGRSEGRYRGKSAEETMLDEDMPGLKEGGNETIVDDDYKGEDPKATDTSGNLRRVPVSEVKKPSSSGSVVNRTEVLQVESELMAWLVLGSGTRKGEQFRLYVDTRIGRDPSNDIILDDTALSGFHVRVKLENGRFIAYDQNSTNGLFAFDAQRNRWEKQERIELQDGSRIKLGRTVFHFMTLKPNR